MGERKNLLELCSKLGFLTLSSVLSLLKVASPGTFLQRLCSFCVCVWEVCYAHAGTYMHTLMCTHMDTCTHSQDTHAHTHPHMRHTDACMHAHTCTHGCTHIRRCAHTHACKLAWLKPQEHPQEERVSAIQFVSLHCGEKSLKASKITLLGGPDRWAEPPGSPRKGPHSAGLCDSGESRAMASSSH